VAHAHINDLFPSAVVKDLVVSATFGHSAFNPSISWSPVEGYRLIVRSSNYIMTYPEGQYLMTDPGGVIRTINHLCVLDSDLNICEMAPIDTTLVQGEVLYPLVRGLEDARLYWARDNRWHAYGTLREHRWDGNCEIVEDVLVGNMAIERRYLANPEPGRTQKNWAVMGNGPWFVYTCSPPATVRTGLSSSSEVHTAARSLKPEVEGFRGGSQAITHEDGYISIIHEVSWETGNRQYFHRFVHYDGLGYVTRFTPEFSFKSPGIEFAAGLVWHQGDLVTTVGVHDRTAIIARINPRDLDAHWIDAREGQA
jgi:hypothetical protein